MPQQVVPGGERSLFREKGFALPILIPNVTSLSWDDIQQIRRHKAVRQLRDNLLEVESEALAAAGGDIERAVHLAYENQIAPAQRAIDAAFPQATLALGEVVVGVAAGYATMGLGAWGASWAQFLVQRYRALLWFRRHAPMGVESGSAQCRQFRRCRSMLMDEDQYRCAQVP